MADENVLINLEINQGGNAREVLRETATASRELARAGAEATGELTRAEVLYQDRLRQRGSILSTLASQQTRAGSQVMGSQERGRDNGAGVVSFGATAAGYPAPQLGQSIQPGTYQVARPVIPAPILPVMPVLKVQVERPIIPAPVMSSPAAQSASSIAATAEAIVARLPHFGTGGTVGGPTVAMIGERGPEAVVPLRRLADGGMVGPFYSRLQRAIEQQAGSKAVPVEAIKNRLRKTRESFSEEEWAAAGMESALAGQRSMTMASLLAHHQANAVRLGEVLKSKKPYPWKGLAEPQTDEEDELRAAFILRNQPRYAQYQTPGGKNYGEMLLTLPLGADHSQLYGNRDSCAGVSWTPLGRAKRPDACAIQ